MNGLLTDLYELTMAAGYFEAGKTDEKATFELAFRRLPQNRNFILAAGLPQAHLKIIPGCAHVPQLQSPRLFLDAIGDFLPVTSAAPA